MEYSRTGDLNKPSLVGQGYMLAVGMSHCIHIFYVQNVSLSPIDSGNGGKILGVKCPKSGAEGAIIKFFSNILEKLFLKIAIKSTNFAI